ncbi:MAG TPA: diaminopimelate epimerase [Candidatus Tumulicola sp.]|nr:diaminopimelate epimerase [Candidatus Tumulicola sp.]
MPTLAVTKVQGTGNDFVLLDNPRGASHDYPALARFLCDRRFGIGADGLLVLLPPNGEADITLRIFNADGSEAESCGNGVRCVARYLAQERGDNSRSLAMDTSAGLVRADLLPGDLVRVDMGRPKVEASASEVEALGRTLTCHAVSVGNPHCVIFVDEDVASIDLAALAQAVDRSGRFPDGVNVEAVRMASGVAQVRVRERGVGETWACGTGACAVAAAAIVTNRATSPVSVTQRGGTVTVAWPAPAGSALLTGPAQVVFRTIVEVPASLLAPDVRVATST